MNFTSKKSKDKKRDRDLRDRLGVNQKTFDDIKKTFEMMDRDHSGSISHAEFKAVMASQKCRSTDQEIHNMICRADRDNSGAIDFEEFAELLAQKCKEKAAMDREISETFARFDENKDGYICRKELQKGWLALAEQSLTDEEAAEIIRSADKDGDGLLCKEEFAQYIIDNQ